MMICGERAVALSTNRVNEISLIQSQSSAMKTLKLLPLLVWFAAVLLGLAPRSARADVSFQFFYDSLQPYGQWLQVGDYGYCWRPNDVDDDWSPYSDGYWAYTDAGWTWVSYEDWGGITYHYGRWVDVRDEGWCWVPDYDWGPAWVSWRNSDDYIGWAPLPPEARWDPDVGFGVWVDNTCDIGPGYYNFCHSYDFGAGFLRPCLIPRVQNIAIIQKTVNITNISINNVNRGVFNGGPNFRLANQRSRRPIPALKLVQRNDIEKVGIVKEQGRPGGRARAPLLRAAQRGNQLEVFAPTVTKAEDPATLKPGKIGKVIEKEKVNKGWAVVKDPEERKQLKQQMQQQTANLTPATAPAKQAQVSDLDMVPQKADPNAASPAATARAKGNGKPDKQPDALSASEALKGAPRDEGKNGKVTDNTSSPGQGRLGKNPSKADELATPDQQTDRQTAKARQAERAMEQQRENALADQERAARQARRRDAEAQQKAESQHGPVASEAGRSDEVDRAVARARRQQELNAQENVQRENQRAAMQARREQAAQAGADRRQEQIESQRQQAVRERQPDMQRQMQIERGQQIQQQQRALENQRGAQQQRQAEAQRQIQIQRQQPPPQAQPQGGGGGGHGGKQQGKDDEQKKQR
jgi:hypothetical protein